MSEKIEELLPDILRKLSSGQVVFTSQTSKEFGISTSSLRSYLGEIKRNFFKNSYFFDYSSRGWVAKEIGFLNKQLLSAEEIIVLNSILRSKNKSNSKMARWQEKVVKNYRKRTSSFIFKQHNNEIITKKMEEIFALIHFAIDSKFKIKILYSGFSRVIYPYKVVNIEYYWYFFGFEYSSEKKSSISEKIKSYTITNIENLEILDEHFKYNFNELDKKMEYALNAFFKPNAQMISVVLLIKEDFVSYINRAQFFKKWKNTGDIEIIKNDKYLKYEIWITDASFQEIMPTILKYMPKILIEEPLELKEKIFKKMEFYKNIYQ